MPDLASSHISIYSNAAELFYVVLAGVVQEML